MTLRLHREVRIDICKSARWSEEQDDGLGQPLMNEIELAFERIDAGPKRFLVMYRGFVAP